MIFTSLSENRPRLTGDFLFPRTIRRKNNFFRYFSPRKLAQFKNYLYFCSVNIKKKTQRNKKINKNKMIGEIFNAKDYSLKPKATIQQTGKTGFNTDAINQLKIDENKAVVLAPDTQDKKVLYMTVVEADNCEHAFPIRKSGAYYYINTKQLYDHMEFDYINTTIMFDLVRCDKYDDIIGGECYKMIARSHTRTSEENEV